MRNISRIIVFALLTALAVSIPVGAAFAADETSSSADGTAVSEVASSDADAAVSEIASSSADAAVSDDGALAIDIASDGATSVKVTELMGADRYATAAAEARYAYNSSEYAIIVCGESYADALSATGLSGALDCPILLTQRTSLSSYTVDTLTSLHVSKVILIGDTNAISASSESQLKASYDVTRLCGNSRYATQLAIFGFGVEQGLWGSNTVIVASGTGYADALSIAPVAYRMKAPVFIVDGNGNLPVEQKRALIADETIKHAIVLGSTASTSDVTFGFLQATTMDNGGKRDVIRLGGANRFETSTIIAQWAVANGYLSWNGVAFASAYSPYDSLAGSVVQGKSGSALLLVTDDDISSVTGIDTSAITSEIRFFGGYPSISAETRGTICDELGITYGGQAA